MKTMYCWRCEKDVPMLNEEEFGEIREVYSDCRKSIKEYREKRGVQLKDVPIEQLMRPVQEKYYELTGTGGYTADELLKHRISLHGPLCPNCGRPLRTPAARLCAACGIEIGSI